MQSQPPNHYQRPLMTNRLDMEFSNRLKQRSGVDFNRCYHCSACTNGCPFVEAMDYTPNSVIRLSQYGLSEEVLNCGTIWICVGCNTCSCYCPMAIDIPALMDTLREMAIKKGFIGPQPDVLAFHREVLHSIAHYGRTHKLEIMLRYKIQKRNWFQDLDVGLRMIAKRKLDLTPSKVKGIDEIKNLFQSKK